MEKIQTDNNSNRITIRWRQIFMIVFAIIALSMTAYATSGGVRMFLTEPYAWVGITALSVGFLALTSLVLGDGISSNKVMQIVLIAPFFLVAVAICWILSFASYHQQFLSVGKSDLANTETNIRQMSSYARDVDNAMNDQINDRKAALIDGEAFTNYSIAIIGLADDLNDRDKKKEIGSKLQAMIDEKRIELLDRESKLQAEETQLQRDLERITANISDIEGQTSLKQDEFEAAEFLIGQVELAMQLEEGDPSLPLDQRPLIERDSLARQVVDAPACNRRRVAGKGGVIPGTCFFALTEKLIDTQVLAASLKQEFDTSLEQLKIARQNQAKQQSVLADLLAQHEIDKLQSSEEFASEFEQDSSAFLQSVNTFINQPSESNFKTTAGYCQNVTDVLSDIDAISELPACAPQAFTVVIKQFNSIDEDEKLVGLACEQTDRPDQIINELRRDMLGLTGSQRLGPVNHSYDRMRTEVLEACFVAAEQNNLDTGPIREGLTNLYDRINPSQDPISKAIGKVNSLFDGTASARDYFPALLALLQELSLLLTKIFWDASAARKAVSREDDADYSDLDLEAKPDDPTAILAAKNLLLNTTFHKQKHLLPHIFDEEYSHEMRSHMRRITDTLFRKKLAAKSSGGISISEDGMAEIARQIERHNLSIQTANAKLAAVSDAVVPTQAEQVKKEPTPAVVKIEQIEKSKTDSAEPIVNIEPVTNNPEIEEVVEEGLEQKPRKRRPIVVRPNFRREV